MKTAIISDVHNHITNLKKVLNYCTREEIKTLVCCGDLASLETLDFLCDNFSGKIFYTLGNMDNDQLKNLPIKTSGEKYKNALLFPHYGEAEIDKKKIAFVHFPNVARELCASGKYAFVFYGHTHKPWEETIDSCKMLNPGNVTNEIYPSTFAVWNTENDKFELIKIDFLQ